MHSKFPLGWTHPVIHVAMIEGSQYLLQYVDFDDAEMTGMLRR
jgi:hypothetical protein